MSDHIDLHADVIVVGGGPRGVSVVERLTARHSGVEAVQVAIIDAVEVGAGATWRTDQTPHFLNNTYAAHTTVYPDESTPMSGPVTPGPDLMQWAEASPRPADRPGWADEEISGLRPWDFPSRRLQGVYFREQLASIAARGGVEIIPVTGSVCDVTADGEQRIVHFTDGIRLAAPVVILAQGMVQARRDGTTEAFRHAAQEQGLTYIEPGMPSERDWSQLPAGEDVLVAGLGANFFDVVAELTAGRGGRYEAEDSSRPFELTYRPSGREPRLLVGSRRGLPYRSKSFYGGLPQGYRPMLATREWFDDQAQGRHLDFREHIWPQIARELALAHLETLRAWHPATLTAPLSAEELIDRVRATPGGALTALVAELVADPHRRIDLDRLDRPDVVDPDGPAWDAWVQRWQAMELESITTPIQSPRAAVNRAFAVLRTLAGKLARDGALHPRSLQADVQGWFEALGVALASGPPPHRTAQLLALVRSGHVQLVGEGLAIDVAGGVFTATSAVRGRVHRARTLAETRMSKGYVDVTNDPLLRALLDSGRARLHTRPNPDGAGVLTRTLDVTPARYTLVNADGIEDERVIAIGIPVNDVQPGSAIGATPGVPSPLIGGADVAAAHALHLLGYGAGVSPVLDGALERH
ncbi:FAD/NAD(P)-binding protein [Bogoriella caseilytica]|uniref:FAD-NAD(P)-binding protein n=1 Tax=Bogoriella caseilytica TaxID=56055 RepID=A0A3N2B9E4_9MICO|nr:FAD/NAD(P)-binding protein [Bogoriella caseilytica]ROR71893.1 FAD-NAD(P)-binding protein [Bogoriella caseilytica]